MLHIARLGLIAVALAAALAACGGTQRTGGEPARASTVLTLANGNPNPEELQFFLDEVSTLSGGRLRIKAVNAWRKGQRHYETGLIRDVQALAAAPTLRSDLSGTPLRLLAARCWRGRSPCADAIVRVWDLRF